MRILLTGSAGFIGSAIYRSLDLDSVYVTRVDKQQYGRDARDFFRVDDRHYDLVIHCAAQVGGRLLIESPMVHAENLEIDAALFQWAERTKPGRIVYISSVAAYPAAYQQWPRVRILREEDADITAGAPDELYGWAKLTGEFLAQRCSVPVLIPRPFTVYGEGQDEKFPFANIARQVRERKDPVIVWGSGNQVRDFIHVNDVVDGIFVLLGNLDGPVNFCTGRGTSLHDLASAMISEAGYSAQIETLPGKPEGLRYRVGYPDRLNKYYTPRISLEEGIRKALQ